MKNYNNKLRLPLTMPILIFCMCSATAVCLLQSLKPIPPHYQVYRITRFASGDDADSAWTDTIKIIFEGYTATSLEHTNGKLQELPKGKYYILSIGSQNTINKE